ncbi:carboxyl-terminal processing protease [Winogradskyella jejuensis]|uniref:Carboxyl-terminal processing protease n=1 Tax=Winogradskyella jejuensis TaxID=1089305 RepID=A0A1M5TM98_9FLAO|nr:carboxyl-terminal processing protease [Winogradskyella jejuensis]
MCCFYFQSGAQTDSFCGKVEAVSNLVDTYHFKPKKLNDSLSIGVYDLFIELIDPKKRLLTQSDTAAFNVDRLKIDDYIKDKNCNFIGKYAKILKSRINESKGYLEALSNAKLDYTGSDSLYFNAGKVDSYFRDESSVKRYWNKRVRYELIFKLMEQDSVLENLKSNFKTLELKYRQTVIENEICVLNEIENRDGGLLQFVEESFLNAYLSYQDPNSSYFNSSEKSLFEQGISNTQFSFGIDTYKNDDGKIIIGYITNGSAAFKNGNFDVNDEILVLNYKNTSLETNCISNDAVVAFLNNEDYDDVNFKIKKKDGSVKTIKLSKEETKVEDNTVKGYIIEGEKRLGYIKISSFYTDLESFNGLGLANDVSKQLYLLQREGIEGLIIDLRYNGGGSMKEAAELTGLFIDRGPVAITKDRIDGQFTVRDPNRGMAFYKPIIVLQDHFSASASEFFAGAMQDYKRAVIVGSGTHGKATSQQIIPLNDKENIGFARLSIQKFYRITGRSHQSIGVIPDIELPDFYDDFKTEEKFYKYAIENDTINTTMTYIPLRGYGIADLKRKSEARTNKNVAFKELKSINQKMVKHVINRKAIVPLTLEGIYEDTETYKRMWQAYSNFNSKNSGLLKVMNTKSTAERLEYNKDEKTINNQYLKTLSNDIHLTEAANILQDVLSNY